MSKFMGPTLGLAVCLVLSPHTTHAQKSDSGIHNYVVILLDGSGSMGDPMPGVQGSSKMEVAKQSLRQVLAQIPAETHVGLIVFGGRLGKDPWIYPLGPRDDARLTAAIGKPSAGGGTPLGKYMKLAADRLIQAKKDAFGYGSFRLLVVTDGEAEDQNLVDRYTPQIMSRGITVDVIGVAMAQDHTLATKVHAYRNANDPEALKQAIEEVFAEVSDQDTDETGQDAFEVLQPLPNELAVAMLEALTQTDTVNIGEKKAIPKQPHAPSAPTAKPSTQVITGSDAPAETPRKSYGCCFYVVVALFLVIAWLRWMTRSRN